MKAILPFVIFGLCAGMYFMYISPLIGEIGIRREKLSEYTSVLEKAKELKVKRDDAVKSYGDISDTDKIKLDKIIPIKFDGVLFLNDMSVAAARYGLVIKEYKDDSAQSQTSHGGDPNVDNGVYKTIVINVKITGPFDQLIKFLKDVETNLQLVDVISLAISGAPTTSNGGPAAPPKPTDNILQYALIINTYSLK